MNRLILILLPMSIPSFVSSEPRYFSDGFGGAQAVNTSPFVTPAFDRLIGFAVLALAIGTPFLPFVGR